MAKRTHEVLSHHPIRYHAAYLSLLSATFIKTGHKILTPSLVVPNSQEMSGHRRALCCKCTFLHWKVQVPSVSGQKRMECRGPTSASLRNVGLKVTKSEAQNEVHAQDFQFHCKWGRKTFLHSKGLWLFKLDQWHQMGGEA